MDRTELKTEALKRMRKIGIYEPTVKQFENDNLVSYSAPPIGACFWLDEEQQDRVKEIEEKYNCIVYHMILSAIDDMLIENYLIVSSDKDTWDYDHEDIDNNCTFVYTYNKTEPYFSEFGTIGYQRTPAHGLLRTW